MRDAKPAKVCVVCVSVQSRIAYECLVAHDPRAAAEGTAVGRGPRALPLQRSLVFVTWPRGVADTDRLESPRHRAPS